MKILKILYPIFCIMTVNAQINLSFIKNESLRRETINLIEYIQESAIINKESQNKNIIIYFDNFETTFTNDLIVGFDIMCENEFIKITDINSAINKIQDSGVLSMAYNNKIYLKFSAFNSYFDFNLLKNELIRYELNKNGFQTKRRKDNECKKIFYANYLIYKYDDNKQLKLNWVELIDLSTFFKVEYNLEEVTKLPSPKIKTE